MRPPPQSQLNKWVFSSFLNWPTVVSDWRSEAGRLFQSLGPATWKARSPKPVWVRGTTQVETSDERSRQRPTSETSWQSSDCLWVCLTDARCACMRFWVIRKSLLRKSQKPINDGIQCRITADNCLGSMTARGLRNDGCITFWTCVGQSVTDALCGAKTELSILRTKIDNFT